MGSRPSLTAQLYYARVILPSPTHACSGGSQIFLFYSKSRREDSLKSTVLTYIELLSEVNIYLALVLSLARARALSHTDTHLSMGDPNAQRRARARLRLVWGTYVALLRPQGLGRELRNSHSGHVSSRNRQQHLGCCYATPSRREYHRASCPGLC